MAHYFENNENLKSEIKEIKSFIQKQEFTFFTDNGVFSKKGLDYGTRILLENIDICKIKGDILDFGCGYGPIGIFISKMTNLNVDMVDINNRSLNLAIKNSKKNNVKTNIFLSSFYKNISKKYDFIITNPPIRIGKKNLYEILFGAKKYLKQNGELWLVINKNQGAKSLLEDLKAEYITETVNKDGGFYVIRAINN
ncbi:MAG: class I SAM-dependent methyltransferase [Bacilli bacterium]